MHYAIVEDRKEDQDYLAGLIRAEHAKKRIPIIFTTSELDFALEDYEVHPLDYLLNRLQMKLPFISMNRAMS